MKLTKSVLFKLITEMVEHGGLSCGEAHPAHTHNEWEGHKKEEEKKIKAMAKISIKPSVIVENEGEDSISKDELKHILRKWENTEYDSDEHRWQEYAVDIHNLLADPLQLSIPEEDPMLRDPPSRLRQTVMKET